MEQRSLEFISGRKRDSSFRELTEVLHSAPGMIEVNGKEYYNLSSNDYLGLTRHPAIIEAAVRAAQDSSGTASSRLMTGHTKMHKDLEERVAVFKGKPAALVLNSGYQANVGVIPAIAHKGDAVFADRLSHASIFDGIRMSEADMFRFRHNDTEHLEYLLKKHRKDYSDAVIITESVFSMDGDVAPLDKIAVLKNRYGCAAMVDEAHATGIFGDNGAGMVQEYGLTEEYDIIMGTFSKALGSFGAYIAATVTFKQYLINCCRSFIYSTSLPGAVIAANIAALDVIKEEPYRRKELLNKADLFRRELLNAGLDARGASQIVPVIIGPNDITVELSDFLKEKGYWTAPVRPPTVPRGGSRLRLSVTYDIPLEVLGRIAADIRDENDQRNQIKDNK